MPDRVNRKCDACKRRFVTYEGSLIRLCDDPGCKQARAAHFGELRQESKREARRVSDLLREPGFRDLRDESIEMLELAARMEVPSAQDVLVAIRRLKNARGNLAKRAALITLSALCIRWAGALPKAKRVIARKGTVDEEERMVA